VGEGPGAEVGAFVGDDVVFSVGKDVGVAPSQMSIVAFWPKFPSPLNVTPFRVTEYDPDP
jgi:hypothetical protein